MSPERAVRLIAALEKAPQAKQDQALAFLEDSSSAAPQALNVPEPYLTLRDLSEKLNFHPTTLWRWRVPLQRMQTHRKNACRGPTSSSSTTSAAKFGR